MRVVEYVRQRDGGWYVGESGVSLYSVIALWRQGYSPEGVLVSFAPLSLREVYGTMLHYMKHREEMDTFCRE